jgi:excisionase family DNA binding protein
MYMETMTHEPLVTSSELAKILGLSESQMGRIRRETSIPSYQVSARSVRFRVDEVLEWFKQERAKQQEATRVK